MLTDLIRDIAQKKAQLDRLRPLSPGALAQLQKYYDIELTYTSNAIEGNTLTHRETAEVIEHGITVGGKPLRDHLEAVDLPFYLYGAPGRVYGGSHSGDVFLQAVGEAD